MAASPKETIRKAAKAYITGKPESLEAQLHPAVRMLGSHAQDDWTNSGDAISDLRPELRRHREKARGVPTGSLVTQALTPTGVKRSGSTARWHGRGSLRIDGVKYPDASWTVVLEKEDGNWSIVHSHFSIHR